MQLTRTLNVITMACLLFLTGCFGITGDTITPEADGQSTTTGNNSTNHAPFIDTSSMLNSLMYMEDEITQTNISFDPFTGDEILNGFNVSLHHAAIDIDGDAMTMGWDIDLDGDIDATTSASSGFTELSIDLSHWTNVSDLIEYGYYQTMIAFIAIDEHGAGNAEFVEIWGYYEAEAENGSVFDDLALYVMDAEDASGSPSDGIDDNLVRVTMTQGRDINWASITVKVSVNNEAPVTCNNPGATGGGCDLVEFGNTADQVWSVGDGVTIKEASAMCEAGETCSVTVTITDTQQGKTLDESSAVAE